MVGSGAEGAMPQHVERNPHQPWARSVWTTPAWLWRFSFVHVPVLNHTDADPAVECLTYSVAEAAKVIGVGRTVFYEQLVATGRLRTVVVGGRRLVPRSAVHELLEGGGHGASAA